MLFHEAFKRASQMAIECQSRGVASFPSANYICVATSKDGFEEIHGFRRLEENQSLIIASDRQASLSKKAILDLCTDGKELLVNCDDVGGIFIWKLNFDSRFPLQDALLVNRFEGFSGYRAIIFRLTYTHTSRYIL